MTPLSQICDEPKTTEMLPICRNAFSQANVVNHPKSHFIPIISPFPPNCVRPKQAQLPQVLTDKVEIRAMMAKREAKIKRRSRKLPEDVDKLEALLERYNKAGRIIWGRKQVYAYLQRYINRSSRNTYLVVGYNHNIFAQYHFFNELVAKGQDKMQLAGLTHLAPENFGHGSTSNKTVSQLLAQINGQQINTFKSLYLGGQQLFLGYYLAYGQRQTYTYLDLYMSATSSNLSSQLQKEALRTVVIARQHKPGYDVIASDVTFPQGKAFLAYQLPLGLEAREAFAVDSVNARLCQNKKNVVAFPWGAEHAVPQALPKHIRYHDSKARVLSVILNGGQRDKSLAFGPAVERLGLANDFFAVSLRGYQDGDLIIHLPVSKTAQVFHETGKSWAAVVSLRSSY